MTDKRRQFIFVRGGTLPSAAAQSGRSGLGPDHGVDADHAGGRGGGGDCPDAKSPLRAGAMCQVSEQSRTDQESF